MDGGSHREFGHEKSCLIALIDDVTSEIHAEFFQSETTQGCLKVIRDYIEQKGLFKALWWIRRVYSAAPSAVTSRKCRELVKSWASKSCSPIPSREKTVSSVHSIPSKTASFLSYACTIAALGKVPTAICKRFLSPNSGARQSP
jgi:hypothetical protein